MGEDNSNSASLLEDWEITNNVLHLKITRTLQTVQLPRTSWYFAVESNRVINPTQILVEMTMSSKFNIDPMTGVFAPNCPRSNRDISSQDIVVTWSSWEFD